MQFSLEYVFVRDPETSWARQFRQAFTFSQVKNQQTGGGGNVTIL